MIVKIKMDTNKKAQVWVVVLIVIFIVGSLGFSALYHFWLAPKVFLTQVDSAHDIIDKTMDANNAIYNYEWFKTQQGKISASELQIDNLIAQKNEFKEMYGDPIEWDFMTKDEYSRLSTTLTGLMNHYESQVAEYNARSTMDNRNLFKDGLPYSVDKKLWIAK